MPLRSRPRPRLADEYDAAQDRGEVAKRGKPVNVPGADIKATAPDLGLTRQQVSEARQVRDAEKADPGIVKRTSAALTSSPAATRRSTSSRISSDVEGAASS